MRTIRATATAAEPPAPPHLRSPWHSPVPYLFGGLAAMLGLIAFALLILACSYWRLSGRTDGGDVDGNEKEGFPENLNSEKVYEEKILVIMAGEHKPTFLATPMSSKNFFVREENESFERNGGGKVKLEDDKGKVEELHETTSLEVHENGETVEGENR